MSANVEQALRLAEEALAAAVAAGAQEAEVVVSAGSASLTRFAANRIHQNVSESDAQVSIRAVLGKRSGVAATNRLDPESLRRCAQAAVAAASSSQPDESFPGLPQPTAGATPAGGPASEATLRFDETARATAAATIIGHSSAQGLKAAGGISVTDQAVAIANTHGVRAAAPMAATRATVLSMEDSGGSGWASFFSADAGGLDADALGEQAASLAVRTKNAGTLDPGTYTVVLAPEAVADIVAFMGWMTFGAKPFAEKRSAFSDKLGESVVDGAISIFDDFAAQGGIGLPFDFEGQPRSPVALIKRGIAEGVVTDSMWAAKLGMPNTGHALPAPNGYGPMPLNLVMDAGDATMDDLVSRVDRGVYVTRFHYVNVEDPVPLTLTGMTRDGTFMIEGGRLTKPLRNLRFTQSAIQALSHVGGITASRELVGSEGHATLVPGLLLERFAFTGQTG